MKEILLNKKMVNELHDFDFDLDFDEQHIGEYVLVSDEEAERIAKIHEEHDEEVSIRERNLIEELELLLDYSEDEYNEAKDEDYADFRTMLQGCLSATMDNHGTLEDAAYLANEAFSSVRRILKKEKP